MHHMHFGRYYNVNVKCNDQWMPAVLTSGTICGDGSQQDDLTMSQSLKSMPSTDGDTVQDLVQGERPPTRPLSIGGRIAQSPTPVPGSNR